MSVGLRSLRYGDGRTRTPFQAQNDSVVSACDVPAGFKLHALQCCNS
jgi:hypothetical protein